MTDYEAMYADRKLADGVPDAAQVAHEIFVDRHKDVPESGLDRIDRRIGYLSRLMHRPGDANMLVVGGGPVPAMIVRLRELGYIAVGVESVTSFVQSGREYVGSADSVLQGSAEAVSCRRWDPGRRVPHRSHGARRLDDAVH